MRSSSNSIEYDIVSNNIVSSAYKYNMYTRRIFFLCFWIIRYIYLYIVLDRMKVWGVHTIKFYAIGLGDDIKVIWHAQYFHCEFSDALRSKKLQYIFKLFCFYFICYLMWHRKNKMYSQLCMLCFYSFIILCVSPLAYMLIVIVNINFRL